MATPPVPGVIDEEMCREGEERLHRPAGGAAAAPADGAVREVALRDAGSLALSFRNVLKIDNLVGFERLVKLELDNNIIERIENIGHLTSLETLDLSFNNISRISGLEADARTSGPRPPSLPPSRTPQPPASSRPVSRGAVLIDPTLAQRPAERPPPPLRRSPS